MRKIFMILTLAAAYLAVTGAATAGIEPPQCDPDCPWVK
jgi:hypothetical protein